MATGPVDLRRGHDGLMAIVRNEWEKDPYSGHLFVFVSRRRNRVKILYYDHGGFVLYYKRLERGRFRLPKRDPESGKMELSAGRLAMLLEGLEVDRSRERRWWKPPSARADLDKTART